MKSIQEINQVIEMREHILEVGGTHEISNLGNVRNTKTLDLVQHNIRPKRYHYVTIGSRANDTLKCISVHRLVAKYFCTGYGEGLAVNHIDGNKNNNTASNLEWVKAKKKVLCVTTGTTYESVRDASRQTGISQGNISQACNGHRDHAGGLNWAFVE